MEFMKISIDGRDLFIRIIYNPNNVSFETIEDALLSYIDKYDIEDSDCVTVVMSSFEGLIWQYIRPSYTIVV